MKNSNTGHIVMDIFLSIITGVTVAVIVTKILRKPAPQLTLQDMRSL